MPVSTLHDRKAALDAWRDADTKFSGLLSAQFGQAAGDRRYDPHRRDWWPETIAACDAFVAAGDHARKVMGWRQS